MTEKYDGSAEGFVYYIVHASAEENEKGTFHFSQPYADEKKALAGNN